MRSQGLMLSIFRLQPTGGLHAYHHSLSGWGMVSAEKLTALDFIFAFERELGVLGADLLRYIFFFSA